MTDCHLLHHNGITNSSLQKLNPLKTILDWKKKKKKLHTRYPKSRFLLGNGKCS